MIRENLLRLRERRALLIATAAHQRIDAMSIVQRVERATVWFDRAKSVALKLRAHPLLVLGAAAVLMAARPRGAFKMFATGFSLWQGWRRLSLVLDRLAPDPRRAGI